MVVKCLAVIHFSGALGMGFKSLIFQFNALFSISADAEVKLSPKSVFHPVSLPRGHPSGVKGDVPAPTQRQGRKPQPPKPIKAVK